MLLFLVISFKYPKLLLSGINTLTPYSIEIYTTEHNIAKRTLTIYDVAISHERNTYVFDEVAFDFTQLHAPEISINSAKAYILNLEAFSSPSSHSSFSPRINVANIQVHYSNEVISGSGFYADGVLEISLLPLTYHSDMLRFFAQSDAKAYIKNQLEQLTFEHINIKYNTATREFSSSGTLSNVIIRPYKEWQTIIAPHIDYTLTKEGIQLHIREGMIDTLDIADEVVMIDWHERNSIQVDIDVVADTTQITQFLQRSPLAPKLQNVLSNIRIADQVHTSANLEFFFDDNIPNIYRIVSEFSDAEVTIQDSTNFIDTTGVLTITPEMVHFDGSANVWNTPLILNLIYDNELRIKGQAHDHNITLLHSRVHEWDVDISPLSDALEHLVITSSVTVDFLPDIPTISIHNLALQTNDNGEEISHLDIRDIPTFRVNAKNITINNNQLPNFATTITNNGVLTLTDTTIENLTTNAATTQFILDTEFTNTHSRAVVKMATSNPESILNILTIPEAFSSTELAVSTELFCECPFWQISLGALSGEVSLLAKTGMVDSELNAFAELLSLLSVESLSKRLELDSGQITTEQLVFTDITTKGKLNNGELELEQFDLNSDDIIIQISGSTNIVDKSHSLKANVTPIIKNAVPAVSLLTGSGLVGLGIWLIDKAVFDEQLLNGITNSLVNFDYDITGTWDNPIVK